MKNGAGSLDWMGRPFEPRAEALHLADNLGPFGTLDLPKVRFWELESAVGRLDPVPLSLDKRRVGKKMR
jgi:hypothetical protein